MKQLLSAELIKLRTTRTFVAIAGLAVGTSLLLTALVALLTEPSEAEVLSQVYMSDTSALFILVLAVVGISGEWRHRTIASSLLAAPARTRFLAAKTLAFAAAGLVMSLLVSLGVTALGTVLLAARDLPLPELGELLDMIARSAVVAALLGALGVAVGALVRNQLVAVAALLVLAFAVEPAVIALAPEVGRFGPIGALPPALVDIPEAQIGLEGVDLVAPAAALGLMLVWIGALFALAAALLGRRDLE